MFDDVATGDILDHIGDHIFGELHKIVVISISHIEFAGSEFGVVGLIDTFVSELLTDFVDSFETTDDQHLKGNN